jgi:hypothetical protein
MDKLPKEKLMNEHNKVRLRKVLYWSRKGAPMSDSDLDFVNQMFRDHADEYAELHRSVVEEQTRELNPMAFEKG